MRNDLAIEALHERLRAEGMRPVRRSDIGGFEFKVFGYTVEIVTRRRVPSCLAVWRGATFIWRIERKRK